MINVILSFALVFGGCEFGECMTERFSRFDDAFSRCKWYLFSMEMKRIYLIVLANTQQPSIVQSYGGIPCSRDSFKSVGIDRDKQEELIAHAFHND